MSEWSSPPDTVLEAIRKGIPAVRAIRQGAGRSQHDVAVAAGMTAERLNAVETGGAPTRDELVVLAKVLDVPHAQLADWHLA